MAEEHESFWSASSQALAPFAGQEQNSTRSGFGGGGFGSQRFGLGHAMNHVGGNSPFGGSTSGFRIGGLLPGNATADVTSVFGRNVSGFSMTLDGTNLRIDLASPGFFGRPSDNVFVRYPADSDGPFGSVGSAFDTAYYDPIIPRAAALDGATTSQVPQTEDFQVDIEQECNNILYKYRLNSISASKPFRSLSFEELRLVDYQRGRYKHGIPGHGFICDPKLGNQAHSGLFGGSSSSNRAFVSYSANSGPFGGMGFDLGASGLSSLPYSPPAAPDGTPAQVPVTEPYHGYTSVQFENGSTETSSYQAITSSTPFMSFSFEELRLVDYQQGRQRNGLPDHGFTTNSNTTDIPFPKLPSIAFKGNKNYTVTSSPTSPTPAFGSGGVGVGSLFRPSFAFGQRNPPPLPSGAFSFGSLPSFTLSATAAGSQGTFNNPFQAYAEQEPSYQYCYQTLGFLNPYKNSSLEELRLADYNQGRRNVVSFDGSVGSPGVAQLKLDTLFGKPTVPGGSGIQSAGANSPLSAGRISTAIAEISSSSVPGLDQSRGITRAIPSDGSSPETTKPSHEASSLSREGTNEAIFLDNDTTSPKLPEPSSEANEETKPPDRCIQQ